MYTVLLWVQVGQDGTPSKVSVSHNADVDDLKKEIRKNEEFYHLMYDDDGKPVPILGTMWQEEELFPYDILSDKGINSSSTHPKKGFPVLVVLDTQILRVTNKLRRGSGPMMSHTFSSAFKKIKQKLRFWKLLEGKKFGKNFENVPLDEDLDIDFDSCWSEFKEHFGEKNWVFLSPSDKENYYHERNDEILKFLLSYLSLDIDLNSDLNNAQPRISGKRVPDDILMLDDFSIYFEVKQFPLYQENDKKNPWENLYKRGRTGLVELNDYAKIYFEEHSNDCCYGVLTDAVNIYFLKNVNDTNDNTTVYMTQGYPLLDCRNGKLTLPEMIPEGFKILIRFIFYLSFQIRGEGYKNENLPYNDDKLIQVDGRYYKVESILGKNSKSVVYSARSEDSSMVSVKVSSETIFIDNEINILKRLQGIKGVPTLLNYGKINDSKSALVTNVTGDTVASKRHDLTDSELESIFLEVAKILRLMHQRNVMHCDIKPDHVILSPNGNIYLIDYGASYILGEEWCRVFTPRLASNNVLMWGDPEPKDDFTSLFYSYRLTKTGHLPWENTDVNPEDFFYDLRCAQEEGQKVLLNEHNVFIKKLTLCY